MSALVIVLAVFGALVLVFCGAFAVGFALTVWREKREQDERRRS